MDLALPIGFTLVGLAEAQRLKLGPEFGLNWIGSNTLGCLHEVVSEDLVRSQQERTLYVLNLKLHYFDLSSGKTTR